MSRSLLIPPAAVLLLLFCSGAGAEPWREGGMDTVPGEEERATPSSSGAPAGSPLDEWMKPAVLTPVEEHAEEGATPAPAQVPIIDEGGRRGAELSGERDLLTLGGLYYQRAELLGVQSGQEGTLRPVVPSLADLFLDVQPSEELRGFVRGRLLYDPLDPVLSTPQAALDQFWFRFSIAQRVFVTAGRQQLKWGSSRIWNPTDFLQDPNPQPLDAVDLRTGIDMLKVNIPWEALASNLWLIAKADLMKGPPSQRLRYTAAVRGEVALGPSELSLMAVFQQGRRPRYGMDWSVGVGPVDFNAELALVRDTGGARRWQRTAEGISERPLDGPELLASSGVETTLRLGDVYRAIVRLEGFYNGLGYDDRALLTWLHSTGEYRPRYFGRAYGLAQVKLDRRSQHEPGATFTVLSNLSDRSFIARLDAGISVLRDVSTQGFIELPLGARGSEFRFEPDPTVADLPSSSLVTFRAGLGVTIRM